MTKEAAMTAYIDEIRKVNFISKKKDVIVSFIKHILKILETMPQTNEVLEFTQLIGPFYEFVDDASEKRESLSLMKKKAHHSNHKQKSDSKPEMFVNGTGESKIITNIKS